ncbi:hypothetical protein [Nitrososphaera viennensis]|uniref:Uncharacterized protein n=2 Tax=Nitrososphaera viennensis TaxID=1034015 RepID=A0A060HKB1_9ARCH|nr:hypothetical protein [Nitrososphaera viennensis]AIC16944.1 hypothetical protein NVIE_026740 [Nitrososphaera viennensis EN76]UVS68847.1 hypothetical protein NWT39_13180 [Nitrososphaera viennensis]CBX88954.1 hypothetical protein [Nitrososphaera phage Pro-Nvie1]
MTYYEIMRLREITLGSPSDTSQDMLLNAKGAQADSQIDDELYIVANRYSKLQSLPALPLAGTMLTQSIRDAATDRAASLFFLVQRQPAMADKYAQSSERAVQAYEMRLDSEGEIYSDST